MDNKDNKIKKRDDLLDLILDLGLDLDENLDGDSDKYLDEDLDEDLDKNIDKDLVKESKKESTKEKEEKKEKEQKKEKEVKEKLEKKVKKESLKEKNKEKNNKDLLKKSNKKREKLISNKLSQEDLQIIEKLVSTIEKEDNKLIKDLKDYLINNSIIRKYRRLYELDIKDSIFQEYIAFLGEGFGYYYSPHKQLIIDFIFPLELIYLPYILNSEDLKINILFREKSKVLLIPKSNFPLKKIFYKCIIEKYKNNIIRELNMKSLDTHNKILLFLCIYIKNYYKLSIKDLLKNSLNNSNHYEMYINLPIKKISDFLGTSYEALIRILKKMEKTNIIFKKENKLYINLESFKNTLQNSPLQKSITQCY